VALKTVHLIPNFLCISSKRRRRQTDNRPKMCYEQEQAGDYSVHKPMGEAAKALSLGAHVVGKYFGKMDPDHRTLGEAEKCN